MKAVKLFALCFFASMMMCACGGDPVEDVTDGGGNTEGGITNDKDGDKDSEKDDEGDNTGGTSNGDKGESTGSKNGHAWVDLGLPSGTLWATCNVGASSPELAGDYFAWGETETKESYSKSNSLWLGVPFADLKSRGVVDANGNLTSTFDVASEKWGDSWRMPTATEQRELLKNCTWDFATEKGVNGYIVTGKTKQHIFIPVTGYDGSMNNFGYYWSSTADTDDAELAHIMYIGSVSHDWDYESRDRGICVRPVCKK